MVNNRLNTQECADYLGRTTGAIRNLVMRKAIPHRKVAGRLLFLRHELDQWIDQAPGVKPDEIKTV